MDQINILILSVGRRVELVQLFKKAAMDLKIKSKVIGADCSNTAPALYFADKKIKLPRINEPNYIDEIINVCKNEYVNLVVPTIDTDLLILSKSKDRIHSETGAVVLISDENVISICRDKIKTHQFLHKHNFGVPKLYDVDKIHPEDLQYPVFVKPIDGSSSKNAYKVNSSLELEGYLKVIPKAMIQDFIDGDEYTVDVFLDFNSKVISVVPRLRLETRSGEISKGKITKEPEIISEIKRLMTILKPIGHITVQLMKTTEGIKFIEINPRFGGGAPMSIQSGADSCKNLYRLMMGHKLRYNEDYHENLFYLRYDQSICLEEEKIKYD